MKEEQKKVEQNRSQAIPAAKLDTIQQLRPNAAGLDLGAEEIYVAVPEERGRNCPCFIWQLGKQLKM